jgi:glutaconate CoA-transferase subunit B
VSWFPHELMAVVLARNLQDGWNGVTPDSPIPMAACLLAQRTHAPGLTFWSAMLGINPEPDRLYPTSIDARYLERVEAIRDMYDVFEYSETGSDFMFATGMQIDRYGNANNVRVGGEGTGRSLTVGGGQANASHPVVDGRILLFSTRHTPEVFVERVDFISVPGFLDGAGARERAGLPGGGPALCVTPLALLDFGVERELRLASVHPDVSAADVRELTGFELRGESPTLETPPPTEEELQVLRALDRDGVLRRG